MDKQKKRLLILGGAGFIGSQITVDFFDRGWDVTVIDGLFPQTGGNLSYLNDILDDITVINEDVQKVPGLKTIIKESDLVIDSMGWTSHNLALKDPLYDLRLNLEAHLHFLNAIPSDYTGKIVYLGSRVQYGRPSVKTITEDSPMIPEDVQGIHKAAAEQHIRLKAGLYRWDAVSLRFPNCFGENQPIEGDDIGLIGSFIRDSLDDKTIEVFGSNRKRYILYVKDLVKCIIQLAGSLRLGFKAYNVAGSKISIYTLAESICNITGHGAIIEKELPDEIKLIDVGDADFSDALFQREIGEIELTGLDKALKNTISYFRGRLK